MMDIEKALKIALNAHEGQKDKGGNPYILHPIAVMNNVETIEEKIVAILHDVVEDTDITLEDLKIDNFSTEVIEAIDNLTRKYDESYNNFIKRCKENELSRKVKIADIKENMDLTRIPTPKEQDFKRLKKYEKALALLQL